MCCIFRRIKRAGMEECESERNVRELYCAWFVCLFVFARPPLTLNRNRNREMCPHLLKIVPSIYMSIWGLLPFSYHVNGQKKNWSGKNYNFPLYSAWFASCLFTYFFSDFCCFYFFCVSRLLTLVFFCVLFCFLFILPRIIVCVYFCCMPLGFLYLIWCIFYI